VSSASTILPKPNTVSRVPILLMTKNYRTFPGLFRTVKAFFQDLLGPVNDKDEDKQ